MVWNTAWLAGAISSGCTGCFGKRHVSLLGRITDSWMAQSERLRNKGVIDAAMASAALVACAGGTVTFAKRNALDEIIDSLEILKGHDVHETVEIFNSYADEIRFQPEQGQARALKSIQSVAQEKKQAELILKIAAAIAQAGGGGSATEAGWVQEVARALQLTAPPLNELSEHRPTVKNLKKKSSSAQTDAGDREATVNSRVTAKVRSERRDTGGMANERTRPTTVAIGNEKGGTGKSTTAVHLIVALMIRGYQVGSLDLDGRQATLTHYLANRKAHAERAQNEIVIPRHHRIQRSEAANRSEAERQEKSRLRTVLSEFADLDFIVIDTPGHDCHLTRLGHSLADILITPLNDSFFDIDVLAKIDRERRLVLGPSPYCEMVWQENDRRILDGRPPVQWIVMRNRLAQLDARNNREMLGLLVQLSERMGFELHPGLSERVVFREMFFQGLTLLDIPANGARSREHARQELDELLNSVVAVKEKLQGQGVSSEQDRSSGFSQERTPN